MPTRAAGPILLLFFSSNNSERVEWTLQIQKVVNIEFEIKVRVHNVAECVRLAARHHPVLRNAGLCSFSVPAPPHSSASEDLDSLV